MGKFLGLIGAGYWGKNLVREFYNLGVLKTICDLDTNLLSEHQKNYTELEVTSDWNELLSDPEIKAICVSAPAELHFRFCKDAILANKHVYVEKPLALSLEEGEKIINLAKEHSKLLMVGHLLQYHPAVIKIQELIKDNLLGEIRYITSNRMNLGKFRREENVLWSFAPHDISVILSLLNNELPEYVISHGHSYLSKDIHDITTTFLSFKSGTNAQINVNWLNPIKEQRMIIVGTKGMLVFSDTEKDKIKFYPEYIKWDGMIPNPIKNNPEVIDCDMSQSPLELECKHFINCCINNLVPKTDGNEGLRVLKVLHNSQESLEENSKKIFFRSKVKRNYFNHETSIIDKNTKIGDGSKVWHYSHLMDCVIGSNCNIGQNVFIANNVKIGNNCKVQNNVSIYEGVEAGNNVFFGPSCVLTNDKNPRCEYSKNGNYISTIIEDGVTIGANSTIVCGIKLGKYCLVGAGAVVTKDIEPYSVVVGNPAKKIGTINEEGLINYA